MAHNLYINECGEVAMAYTGDPPWHRLGTRVEGAVTAHEMMKAAKMDWRVERFPVLVRTAGVRGYREVKGYYAVARAGLTEGENCPVYSIVSENYQVL
ncbi:MAG: hypothetical protein GX785_14055 [Armatimonadetes bacterium]|nr:hypothetical protein [Armatimonadota bacterium]